MCLSNANVLTYNHLMYQVVRSELNLRPNEYTTRGTGRWFPPPPSSVTLDSEVNLLRKIYCCAIWNVKLSRIVVWVLQRIYRCIILNVNCPEWLYEYYKRSTVVLYWMLIVTNGCMSITKDLSLYYVEGYLSRMFIWDLWRIYYCVIHSAKLLLIFVWVLQRICCCIILNINCHEWLNE
jgi:hypothetical protein